MERKKNLCYYSNKCQWSKAFIMEISTTNYKSDFQYICVDPPVKTQLPKWLTKVPTLVIQGESEPRTDGEVMNWLYENKMKQQTKSVPSKSDASVSEPDAWSMAENVSFSKNVGYSFNDSDTSTQGNGGTTIPGSFAFLNGSSGMGEKTSQDFNPGKTEQGRGRSKKEEMFDKQMEEYQRSRDLGLPGQLNRM